MKKALLALLFSAVTCFAQSPYNQSIYPAQSFTATAQTGAIIALNGATGSAGSSYGAGTFTVSATSLTTVTLAVQGSSDGGLTYFALPITPLAVGGSQSATVTATAAGLYQISLVGITHVKFVTSGTFTASGLTVTLTATPQVTVSRSGGAAPGATLIKTLNGGSSSVVFSAIPQTFTNLWLIVGSTNSDGGITVQTLLLRFNGDSGFNYSTSYIQNAAGTVTGVSTGTASSIIIGVDANGQMGATSAIIPNYSNAGLTKVATAQSSVAYGSFLDNTSGGGIWTNTAAITSITITHGDGSGFAAGDTFSLYGL